MPAASGTKPSLTLKRRLNARPEKVFAAWTRPEQIMKWFGPGNCDKYHAEMDLRVGGKYSIAFRTLDSGEDHKVGGVYREIVPNEKLVFTWAWQSTPERESLVTVTIKSNGEGSILTLLHEQLFDENAATGHNRGWNASLDKMERMFI
jgi:uncharacterized protein YndB with AHSA1/START domain